jgi:hypothetical protein
MIRARGTVGQSAPEAIWITIPVAALIRLTTFSLPAADNLLGLPLRCPSVLHSSGQMTSRRYVGAAAT